MKRLITLAAGLTALCGCSQIASPPAALETPAPVTGAPAAGSPLLLRPVSGEMGIKFSLGHGGRSPLTILETAGGGCAFLDFDTDGWPDILLVGPQRLALYRNEEGRRFTDVTKASGLRADRYWMGCATGDYNGDGLVDLFLTGYRCSALYRNDGQGRFTDVSASAGLPQSQWSLSAAFADVDLDGDLDLFAGEYVDFGPDTIQICQLGSIQSACGPEIYQPLSGQLYINDASRFRPEPGWKDTGKTWGVLISRLTSNRRPAIYLANDMMPGDLWVHREGGWKNMGPHSGTAYDGQGHLQGGMGVDSGDYDRDGRLDLLVTTYFAQAVSLYRNDGDGLFTVTSGPAGLASATMPYVAFGTAFADLDNDGWQDLVIANGHVRDNVREFDRSQSYRQPIQVFRNEKGRYSDVSDSAFASDPGRPVGRGLSTADYDRDGKTDVLICDLEGKALLLHNESESGHWLQVRLAGSERNRQGLGALVTVTADGQRQVREVKSCGSVLSALDPTAQFGLGDWNGQVEVTVEWPEGGVSRDVSSVDRIITIRKQ